MVLHQLWAQTSKLHPVSRRWGFQIFQPMALLWNHVMFVMRGKSNSMSGVFENHRYCMYSCTEDHKLAMYSKSKHQKFMLWFRIKTTVKTLYSFFMFLSTVNFQTTIENTEKKCETDAGRSKNQAWFLFEKYQSFLLFVDRACEIVQTPLSSCRLFFLGARSPQEQHTLSSPHLES